MGSWFLTRDQDLIPADRRHRVITTGHQGIPFTTLILKLPRYLFSGTLLGHSHLTQYLGLGRKEGCLHSLPVPELSGWLLFPAQFRLYSNSDSSSNICVPKQGWLRWKKHTSSWKETTFQVKLSLPANTDPQNDSRRNQDKSYPYGSYALIPCLFLWVSII